MGWGDVITPAPQKIMQVDKKMLIGIDEFTFTILLKYKCSAMEWISIAEHIIMEFSKKTQLETVLRGSLQLMTVGKLQGYTTVYDLGEKDFYIALGYNPSHPKMGVCVRFSAKAWLIYRINFKALYSEDISLPVFIKRVKQGTDNHVRLSRIDMTIDYFNYVIDLDEMYAKLRDKELVIRDDQGRSLIRTINFYGKNQKIETIYLGSKKENSKGFMRVYNKKLEQIQNNGYRKQEAIACQDWIRCEAVYKGGYAHLISETIMNTEMDATEFKRYIAQIVAQKYRFFNQKNENYTEYTTDLLNVAEGKEYPKLYCESARDNSLNRNIEHLRKGSGLFPTMYKVQQLYGIDGLNRFWNYLFRYYKKQAWVGNDTLKELDLWLKKHEELKKIPLESNY